MRANGCLKLLKRNVSNFSRWTPDKIKKLTKWEERDFVIEKINALNTVEEKLFAVNMEKYYGWNSLILKEGNYPFNFLPFASGVTRTRLITESETGNVDEYKALIERIRPHIQDAILFELKGRRPENVARDQNDITKAIVERINGILLSSLSTQYPHLIESMVDYDPRLEAFWLVGNFKPSDELYNERKKDKDKTQEEIEEPVEHWFQYFGSPLIQLRQTLPLKPLENLPGGIEIEEIPKFTHDPPLTYGIALERRHGTNIPGFWPGDRHEFTQISYHSTNHLINRPPQFGENDKCETLHSQAMLAGFASLHAQACYQGFSTYCDLTYPLVSQNVLTDGKNFSFYLYQLNTMLFHSDHTLKNPKVNFCLNLPSHTLYQEIKGNEFIGWSDMPLLRLVSFYLNKPEAREDLKPFLNPAERYVANIEDKERRTWLHDQFKHMYSNRPRHRLPYEIYDWERIYKIKFETRPQDARLRPFERDENPLEERKYYEHMPPYIMKKDRPKKKSWLGWRSKFSKMYYPEIYKF